MGWVPHLRRSFSPDIKTPALRQGPGVRQLATALFWRTFETASQEGWPTFSEIDLAWVNSKR
jgi:hypothetical protein